MNQEVQEPVNIPEFTMYNETLGVREWLFLPQQSRRALLLTPRARFGEKSS